MPNPLAPFLQCRPVIGPTPPREDTPVVARQILDDINPLQNSAAKNSRFLGIPQMATSTGGSTYQYGHILRCAGKLAVTQGGVISGRRRRFASVPPHHRTYRSVYGG